MATVSFSGSSDDIIATDGLGDKDVNGKPIDNLYEDDAYFLLRRGDEVLGVKGKYGATGCWHFFPFIVEEDLPRLDVECKTLVKSDLNAYTTQLQIDVPEGTTVEVFPGTKVGLGELLRLASIPIGGVI